MWDESAATRSALGLHETERRSIRPVMTAVSLGIDFGTSATKAAVVVDGRVQLVLDDARAHISSTVYAPQRGGLVLARSGEVPGVDPSRTLTSIKRLLGRTFNDPRVRELDAGVGYRIVRGREGWAHIEIDGVEIAPVQIVATILRHVRECAERMVRQPIDSAVLSMPVKTCSGYAPALLRAAELAGLRSVQLVFEPVAALWGSRMKGGVVGRRILVSDFGAGTYDCALLQVLPDRVDVMACGGDEYLGGDDFDLTLADSIAGDVFRTQRTDLRRDIVAWNEIVRASERAKRRLSTANATELHVGSVYVKNGVSRDVSLHLHRGEVEPKWKPLVDRALSATVDALALARSPAALVDDLVLVGGTNLIPLVRSSLVQKIGKQPTSVTASDIIIAAGLAMMATHAPAARSRAAG
jgi:molecular chaperone DnaK